MTQKKERKKKARRAILLTEPISYIEVSGIWPFCEVGVGHPIILATSYVMKSATCHSYHHRPPCNNCDNISHNFHFHTQYSFFLLFFHSLSNEEIRCKITIIRIKTGENNAYIYMERSVIFAIKFAPVDEWKISKL